MGSLTTSDADICIYEVQDGTSYSKSKYTLEGVSGTSGDFETEVFVWKKIDNSFESEGTLYEGDERKFTINNDDGEVIIVVVKPLNSGNPYYLKATH